MAGLMLDCVICSSRKWVELTPAQSNELSVSGATMVACETCNRNTYWKFAEHDGRRTGTARRMDVQESTPQTAASLTQEDRRSVSERRQSFQRQNYRVPLQLPIRIRYKNLARSFEEVTTTINMCRNGVYFSSRYPHSKGAIVFVTTNYSPTNPESNIEQLGSVVRVENPVPPSAVRGVAVKFS